jgi:pSer/pThr/pTyr-binding forkhead associated (FHA) protein
MPRITLKDLETEKSVSCPYTDAIVGRDPASALPVEGPNAKVVSAQHARVFFQDGAWWIQDLSRNGTVVDNERLIKGERHTLRVGQVIGLGDSGPRLRVEALESRLVAETFLEIEDVGGPGSGSPDTRRAPPSSALPSSGTPIDRMTDAQTAALRKSEAKRAGLRVEEPTEPMKPAADWVVHVVLRMTHTKQRYDVRGEVIKTGRSPECNVQIPPELGASVSRVHAEIALHDGGIVIRDAGSRNGTFVNGIQITEPQPARRGDVLMLGPGGPTLTIEEMRIVKGELIVPKTVAPRAENNKPVGASPSAERLKEPDTEPPEEGSLVARFFRGVGRVFGK